VSFVNRQIWLPPSDNYITHVAEQSDTADHYRAISDQVNMASNDRAWEKQNVYSQTAGISRKFIDKKLFEM